MIAGERGATLIEVMVSSVVLVLMALGLMSGFDATAKTSNQQTGRAVAATLAQQDQERMRALLATDLSNLNQTRTQLSEGRNFTIASTAEWVTNSSGSADCAASATADYLKITSAVSWPDMGISRPVEIESLVSPPNGSFSSDQGAITAEVRKADGTGLSDATVTATGPSSTSGSTNVNGCVLFGHLLVGTYDVTVSKLGHVDRQGAGSITQQVSVVAQTTNAVAFDYDAAAALDIHFDTSVAGAAQASKADVVTLGQPGLAAPFTREFGVVGSVLSAVGASSLFPFTDPYAVYAGDCSAADPRAYGDDPALISAAPGATTTVTVRVPAINLLVTRLALPLGGAHVVLSPAGPGCSTRYTRTTDAAGALTDPGIPYGDWNVCADDGSHYAATLVPIQNHAAAGTLPVPLVIAGVGPVGQGTCA